MRDTANAEPGRSTDTPESDESLVYTARTQVERREQGQGQYVRGVWMGRAMEMLCDGMGWIRMG